MPNTMQATSVWPVLFSLGKPCLLNFQRDPQSTVMHGNASPAANRQIKVPSPLLLCKYNGHARTFVDIETGESWGEIIRASSKSEDDSTSVLSAPSLGIIQLPLSRFLDNMDDLSPGMCTFRMRTAYGAHTWFRTTGAPGTVILECRYPPKEEPSSIFSSFLPPSSTLAQGTSGTPAEVFQPPHLDSDPNFQSRWPFSFYLKAIYRTVDDFDLEVMISEVQSDPSIVEEATKALAHAAIISVFMMNDTIHME